MECCARRFGHLLFERNLSSLEGVSNKRHVLEALSNMSKFLGVHSLFRQLKEESGMKWNEERADLVFQRIYDSEICGIEQWLRSVKAKVDFDTFFPIAFCGGTGLRVGEAFASLDLMEKRGLEGYLKDGVLEHFHYPHLFFRRCKKAFISILTDELVEELQRWKARTSYPKVRKRLMKAGLEVRISDLRKAFATYLVTHNIDQTTTDMVQGRVGTSVFSANYFRPDITGLVCRVRNVLNPYVHGLLDRSG
jgi:intergrase/recombinase